MLMVDPRRGSSDILAHIPAQHKVIQVLLDNGDFKWIGYGPRGLASFGIELKKLSDFLACIEDKRLVAKQLTGMLEDGYDYIFVMLQDRIRTDGNGYLQVWRPKSDLRGAARYNRSNYEKGYWCDAFFGKRQRILWSTLWKMLAEINVGVGVRWLFAGSNDEVGRLVAATYETFRIPWHKHTLLKGFDESQVLERVEVREADTQFSMLVKPSVAAKGIHAAVYGLGWIKAMAAAEHFRTLRLAATATEEDWREVEGIDKVLAARAVRAFDEEHVYRTVSGAAADERRRKRSANA